MLNLFYMETLIGNMYSSQDKYISIRESSECPIVYESSNKRIEETRRTIGMILELEKEISSIK